MRASYLAADRCPIADMILGFGGRKFLGLGVKGRDCQQTKRQQDKRPEGFHTHLPFKIPGDVNSRLARTKHVSPFSTPYGAEAHGPCGSSAIGILRKPAVRCPLSRGLPDFE